MSTNFQKTPFVQSLAKAGEQKAHDGDWAQGKGYPCIVDSVVGPGIVVVNFQVSNQTFTLPKITMPVAKPPYIKYPIKAGDKGVAIPADLPLGAMTGLGAGNPNPQIKPGNLSCLHFVWLGNTSETFLDNEAVTIYDNLVCGATQLAFFGEAKVSKQTLPAAATDLGSCIALANALRTALINYGLA